jgi:hydrogenase expression/formation protein HypC
MFEAQIQPGDCGTADPAHCVTCSDEAVCGRVLQLTRGGMALVEFADADRAKTVEEISLELVEAGPGDIVLVHARVAIARVASAEDREEGDCGKYK